MIITWQGRSARLHEADVTELASGACARVLIVNVDASLGVDDEEYVAKTSFGPDTVIVPDVDKTKRPAQANGDTAAPPNEVGCVILIQREDALYELGRFSDAAQPHANAHPATAHAKKTIPPLDRVRLAFSIPGYRDCDPQELNAMSTHDLDLVTCGMDAGFGIVKFGDNRFVRPKMFDFADHDSSQTPVVPRALLLLHTAPAADLIEHRHMLYDLWQLAENRFRHNS